MEKLKAPYKNAGNQRYSKQLFLEKWREISLELRTVEPPFTLYLRKEGYVCLGEEFVKDADPTGYKTAMRIFGEYAYWEYLCGIRWFVEALDTWNKELDAKLSQRGYLFV